MSATRSKRLLGSLLKNPSPDVKIGTVDVESRIPAGRPIRKIRKVVDQALAEMDDVFDAMYAETGRPSIPPEQLLRALAVQMIHTIRSERQLMKRINYDMLFRWFVGLSLDDLAWHPVTFTKNRDRLLAHGVDKWFLAKVNQQAYSRRLLSHDHFSLDGTLLDGGDRHSGAGGGIGLAGQASQAGAASHGGLRQGLRQEGFRAGMQGLERHAAHRREAFRQGGGRAHHPTCGLSGEHGQAQARRGAVRLGQDHGSDARAEASRASQGAMAVSTCGDGVQRHPDDQDGWSGIATETWESAENGRESPVFSRLLRVPATKDFDFPCAQSPLGPLCTSMRPNQSN